MPCRTSRPCVRRQEDEREPVVLGDGEGGRAGDIAAAGLHPVVGGVLQRGLRRVDHAEGLAQVPLVVVEFGAGAVGLQGERAGRRGYVRTRRRRRMPCRFMMAASSAWKKLGARPAYIGLPCSFDPTLPPSTGRSSRPGLAREVRRDAWPVPFGCCSSRCPQAEYNRASRRAPSTPSAVRRTGRAARGDHRFLRRRAGSGRRSGWSRGRPRSTARCRRGRPGRVVVPRHPDGHDRGRGAEFAVGAEDLVCALLSKSVATWRTRGQR